MRIRTLLNNCHNFKSFVYKPKRLETILGQASLVIEIEARKNGKPICSGCDRPGTLYNHTYQTRLYEFIPFWRYHVYFRYRKRRVDCVSCGVKVERVRWSTGKQQLTQVYQQYLAKWATPLSWQEMVIRTLM